MRRFAQLAIACVVALAACGHDDGGQPSGPVRAAQWARTYGTEGFEAAKSVQPTADGGYVVGGNGIPPWLLKLDANSNVVWQKAYRSTAGVSILAMQATADGGYLMAGGTGGHAWVMKVDALGNILWQRMYELLIWPSGGPGVFVQETADGGSVVVGGYYEGWVLKLDAGGNIMWQRTYGGAGEDSANDVRPTADGGHIVVGETISFNMFPGAAWVLKLDGGGNVLWQKTYGGVHTDSAGSIELTADGGYVLIGETQSLGAGSFDAWVLKLDASGGIAGCANVGTSNLTSVDTDASLGTSAVIVDGINVTQRTTTVIPDDSTAVSKQHC